MQHMQKKVRDALVVVVDSVDYQDQYQDSSEYQDRCQDHMFLVLHRQEVAAAAADACTEGRTVRTGHSPDDRQQCCRWPLLSLHCCFH